MSIFSHTLRSSGSPRGFTLIELLAVTAIMTVITLVLLLRQTAFDSSTVLRSLTYNIALSVRQAQVYGVAVVGSSTPSTTSVFASAYGIYYIRTVPTSYVLFADYDNNGLYDATTEKVKTFSIRTGYQISEACTKLSSGVNRCTGSDDATGTRTISSVTILFKRPNPDAVIKTNRTTETNVSAWFQIQSPAGATRSILITTPGQITVQPPGTLP